MGSHSIKPTTPGRRRHRLAVVGGSALAVALATSIAGASTTSEGIVSVAPHNLTTGAALTTGKSLTYVVSGAATTVPTDATRVQFAVTVSKQQQSGTLTAAPYLDAADASGDSLSWAAANTTVSGTLLEPVGVGNKVTFTNSSAGTLTVAVKITGYSTSARLAVRLDTAESAINSLQSLNAGPRLNAVESSVSSLQFVAGAVRRGFGSSVGIPLTAGDNYIVVTAPFTPTGNLLCTVTSSVQMTLATPAPVGAAIVYVRNAVRRDGNSVANDTHFGHYLTATGTTGVQPDVTRTSLISVSAGHSVEFGAFLGNVAGSWLNAGNSVAVSTEYDCRS
jgi:hypothetical protein